MTTTTVTNANGAIIRITRVESVHSNRWWLILLGLLAVGFAATGVYLLWKDRRRRRWTG